MLSALPRWIARRLIPDFDEQHPAQQVAELSEIVCILYSLPLAVIGLAWLVQATDWAVFGQEWALLALILAFSLALGELNFYYLVNLGNIRGGGSFYGSLVLIADWSAVFIVGATGLWLALIAAGITLLRELRGWRTTSPLLRLQTIRNTLLKVAEFSTISLIALAVYRALDGPLPLTGFSTSVMLAAGAAVLARLVLAQLLTLPYIIYAGVNIARLMDTRLREVVNFALLTSVLGLPIEPFSILAAGIYATGGLAGYVFFMAGLLLAGALTQRLSQAAERSRQRTQELDQLEQLGRAIISGPPDASTLPDLLQTYVPDMFTQSAIAIRLFPDRELLKEPAQLTVSPAFWQWMKNVASEGYCLPGQPLPWQRSEQAEYAIAYAPILDTQTGKPSGGIYLLTQHPDEKGIVHLLPALQSLAAQIASALRSAEVYRQTLEHEKTAQELAVAGRIQASFLPDSVPDVAGWQLSAQLEPARATSGDFYDFIPLPDERLGLVVADVADKGVGAALYMALSRTLIRTYAAAHPDQPAQALQAANQRILQDTQSNLFVTVFYGVLDLAEGTLTYCNAGHNPGYLCLPDGSGPQALGKTGIPLGMFEDFEWTQDETRLPPGAWLALYSDGLTEAHNPADEIFSDERLLDLLRAGGQQSIAARQQAILEAVRDFRGESAQFDDITLVMVGRENNDAVF